MNIPAISTIELSKACNFNCSYCQRNNDDGSRKSGHMSLDTVQRMIEWGDFDNTFYLELQLDGEPTLNPNFNEIVKLLKDAVPYLGMSTNASFMNFKHRPHVGVAELDAITISVHPETKNSDIFEVCSYLDSYKTKVRIQTLAGVTHNVSLDSFKHFKNVSFDNYPLRVWGKKYGKKNFCADLNSSVSVLWNGDVVPCCNDYSGENILGNINYEALPGIWREYSKTFTHACKTCATPSPYIRRLNFFMKQMEL